MAIWLKQSTAVTLKIGPFLDDTDGKTAETGLTVSQADVRLSKNGGDIAQKNESTSCTHDELGIYGCPVDTTDTGTLGRLQLWVHESGALPVWHEFMVVPANVWDSFYGADYLQTHAVEITNGLITAAAIATGAIDADAIADNAIDAGALAADCITSAKIADNAIAAEHLAAAAIDFATFAADCKTGTGLKANVESISANAITATAINADAITSAKIADDAISAEHLNTGAITADAFAADAIVAATLATGALTADAFAADAIVAATLATGAITADAFAANAIVAATLAADCITEAKIADSAIAAEHIADGAIDAATFAAGAINAAAIANGAIDNATFAADVGSTAYATNIIALAANKALDNYDPPTNAEFELRSLAAADYTVVSDLGVVQTGDTFALANGATGFAAINTDVEAILADTGTDGVVVVAGSKTGYALSDAGVDAIFDRASSATLSFETLILRTYEMVNNKMAVTEASGDVVLRNIGDTGNIATGNVASSSGTTTRAELSWA